MNIESIDAILFDFDNTLVPFMEMKHAAMDAGIDAMLAQVARPEERAVAHGERGVSQQHNGGPAYF
jgi:FMN phosphatase YigB (HAD superfamily)